MRRWTTNPMDTVVAGRKAARIAGRMGLLQRPTAWIRLWLASGSDQSVAQRVAGAALLIRVAGAALVFLSQILFARWMGDFDFGIYVYVWTWVLLIGDVVHMGLASAAQRFIPEYTQTKAMSSLRGFLGGSRWLVFGAATLIAALGAVAIRGLSPWLERYEVLPLYLACATLPAYALSNMLDGIARSYNWVNVALAPPYVLRPLILITALAAAYLSGITTDAATAMGLAIVATWVTAAVQLVWLNGKLARVVEPGGKAHDPRNWLATALPILMVWGFYTLLTYTDVLMLRQFRPPGDVAVYYAASKTLALVAFIYFSVAAAVAHRFAEYHVAGDRDRLAELARKAAQWTFWPSLAACALILALGRPILWLFGPEFTEGYGLMFILAIGLLARASVGPAERLLNMIGEQRRCGRIYVAAFLANLLLCITLIPVFGPAGAAVSLSAAMVIEATLLFLTVRRRTGAHVLVVGHGPA